MAGDPYVELGVSRGASADDIRRAFRRLAKELHPDARPNDKVSEERFKRVSAAFDILGDPEKKRRFDRGEIDAEGAERRAYAGAGASGGRGAWSGAGSAGPESDLNDFFSSMFTDGAPRRGPYRTKGEDVRYRLPVSFSDACLGARRRVVMGDGRALDIVIPEGVRTGQTLRLRGQGRAGAGPGATPGDALVEVEVEAHPHFTRDGDDIRLDVPVTLKEAVLGAKITVPTLTGPVALTVPKGANTGAVLRLRGKGVKSDGARGDQLVRLLVVLPEALDPQLTKFLADWAGPRDYDPRRHFDI